MDRLHEAVFVDRNFGKRGDEIGPPVMVARQQPVRHGQCAKRNAQIGIALRRTGLRQVAGEDAKRGVGVMRIDVRDAPIQPLMQVRPIAALTSPAKMHVGDLDDFHARLLAERLGNQSAGSGTEALKTSRRVPVSDEKKCMSSGEIFRPTVLPGSG